MVFGLLASAHYVVHYAGIRGVFGTRLSVLPVYEEENGVWCAAGARAAHELYRLSQRPRWEVCAEITAVGFPLINLPDVWETVLIFDAVVRKNDALSSLGNASGVAKQLYLATVYRLA